MFFSRFCDHTWIYSALLQSHRSAEQKDLSLICFSWLTPVELWYSSIMHMSTSWKISWLKKTLSAIGVQNPHTQEVDTHMQLTMLVIRCVWWCNRWHTQPSSSAHTSRSCRARHKLPLIGLSTSHPLPGSLDSWDCCILALPHCHP